MTADKLQTRETMLRSQDRTFIPGFETEAKARRAGARFYARNTTLGPKMGREGRDFHLIQNEHGRWHFEEGRKRSEG